MLSRLAYVSNVESHLVAYKDRDCPDVDRFFGGLGYWRFHVNGRKLKQKFSDLAGVTEKLQPSMQAAIKTCIFNASFSNVILGELNYNT